MRAVIVAAGLSSRLRPLTTDTPKGLLRVGETTLLDRSVSMLHASGHDEIIVVVGFRRDAILSHLGARVRYVHNPFYSINNNMASLWFALATLGRRAMTYIHGDLVYSRRMLDDFLAKAAGSEAALSVDFGPTDDEAMKVKITDGCFSSSSKGIPPAEAAGEWTGLTRFSQAGVETLYEHIDRLLEEGRFQDYDTAAFTRMAAAGHNFDLIPTRPEPWCEVDTLEDLERARSLFTAAEPAPP